MLIVPTAYLAPIQYYAYLYARHEVVEDRGEHFVKQSYRNRCYIATPAGAQALTIPVERAHGSKCAVRDLRLSDHGRWRHLHWQALVSAYDNTPYFFYYADDFRPLYEHPFTYLVDFNEALRETVCDLLSIHGDLHVSTDYLPPRTSDTDLRTLLPRKGSTPDDPHFHPRPYYQVFGDRTGFLANLSIVDLLFNLGPESRTILRDSLRI